MREEGVQKVWVKMAEEALKNTCHRLGFVCLACHSSDATTTDLSSDIKVIGLVLGEHLKELCQCTVESSRMQVT